MSTKRLKVTVKDGFEERFIEFCERFSINCKQYPIEALKTRFGIDDNSLSSANLMMILNNFDGIKSIEDMPTISLG